MAHIESMRGRQRARDGEPTATTRRATGTIPKYNTCNVRKRDAKSSETQNKRQAGAKVIQRIQAVERHMKHHTETPTRLKERSRWRKGRKIPGGGWEIEYDSGTLKTPRWVRWLYVRPSVMLAQIRQHQNDMPSGDAGWGLYAARQFKRNDPIVTS